MRWISADETFPHPTRLADRPELWILDGFLGTNELDALTDFFADEERALSVAWHAGADEAGYAAEFPADADPSLRAVADKMEALLGVRSALERSLRLRAYARGEGHRLHCDAYEIEGHKLAVTGLVYLADTEAGGETRFPQAAPGPLAIAPRAGRFIAWTSTGTGGADDPYSVHAADAVRRGTKLVLMVFSYLPLAEHPARLAIGR
jgi:hypothetical protein